MYVQMDHIYKTFDGFHASSDVSFVVEKGQLAALQLPLTPQPLSFDSSAAMSEMWGRRPGP